ncbi:MAG: T9SS type A sorting domain-containing protein [bacterium]|nr:T9SS type A sorting domain-containing protein [bacterium]
MKKKLQITILISISFIFSNMSFAQTTIYSENFSSAHNWTLNVLTGKNDAIPNAWEVNDSEGGVTPSGCGISYNGNSTLHVTCTSYLCGSFITGAVYNAQQNTSRRAESPVFSTVGLTNISLKFNFISNGDGLNDNASLLYYDGNGWQTLVSSLKSNVCASGAGQWTEYIAKLPISAENNPNVKIGFNWINNNDNVGNDPSFAVDNIIVYSSTLSVSKFDLNSEIKIYPNPANNILNIESLHDDTFIIINQLGQEIKRMWIKGNITNEINISDLNKGLYFVESLQTKHCSKILID